MRCAMKLVAVTLVLSACAGAFAQEKLVRQAEGGRFEILGLGGGGGMFSPTGSPHDKNLMFVSCDMGGFYVSEDAGKHWWMTDWSEMRGSTTCRPAFHPTDKNIVYMPYKDQVRVSRDRGKHWEVLGDKCPWAGAAVHAINTCRDPKLMFVSADSGVFMSSDGGKQFAKCEGVQGKGIWVYVLMTVDTASKRTAKLFIAGTSAGVFVSTDDGKTWAKKGAGLPAEISGFCACGLACFAAAADGVYVSSDGGYTFAKVTGLPNHRFRFACMCEESAHVAYVTDLGEGWGAYKTTDAGKTWTKVYRMMGADQNVLWGWLATEFGPGWGGDAIGFGVNPAYPDIAMYTNSGELFITTDGGKSWSQAMSTPVNPGQPKKGDLWQSNGLEVTTTWQYYFDPFDAKRTYICYTDIGFARSSDRGTQWQSATKGSPWQNTFYELAFDPAQKGVLYAAAASQHDIPSWTNVDRAKAGGGVVKSTDSGATWQVVSSGLPKNNPCTSVALDPKSDPNSRTLYAAMFGDGVYKSADGGKSWQKKPGVGREGNFHVYAVRFGPDGALYALVTGKRNGSSFDVAGGLWRSADGGDTWTELTAGQNFWWPTEFAVHPKDPKKIFLSNSDVPQKSGGGLYATEDGGKTWKPVLLSKDLDQKILNYSHPFAVTFAPANPDVMYLSTWTHGLQRSTDGGKTWKMLKGVPFITINRVSFDPADPNMIYVTTFGGGVWKGRVP